MWIWLILSLVLVIACIIFGIHSFLSSRTLQRSISAGPIHKRSIIQRNNIENDFPSIQQHDFSNVKIKLKAIEGNSVQQAHQMQELLKRIEALEEERSLKNKKETGWNDDDEDWEKMYYETLKEKDSLEEKLNSFNDALTETKAKLEELEKEKAEWADMKSDMETRLTELHSLQNVIDNLQRKLEGANERETELEKQLTYEKFMHVEYDLLKKQNNELQSEAAELTKRLEEINAQNIIMEQKLNMLTELESSLEISEFEKMEIKNSVEEIIAENMALSEKLQELQHKLVEEKKYSQ